ncbi:MAG TPA: PAS domain S-box protein, partial [Thermoguttaceae bacterium]|nr:PAS domain S-box protein [Thermoguttaceae bacterium]
RTNELAEANRELEEEVAERRRAEMWLLQSEQRFRSYFEQGLVGMAILSPEKEWEEVNARLCEILGYSEEELLATSWTELTHPDERADDEAQFDRIGSGIQGVFSVDRRLLHKDGRTVFVTLSVKCLCDVDGKIDCLVVLVQDITQRKRALENLQAEKNLSEAMFNSMPGIFCAFDPSGLFLRWNKQFEKVTGYSPEEILGMDPVDFFPPADRQWVKEEIREVLQRGWGTMEAEFLTKDGTRLPYSFSGVRYEIAGHPCMLGTGVNISDRKRAEKERESLIAALEGKNAEMERFVYTVSHDLKSPLVTIQGFLGLSEQDIEDGDLPRLRADLARIHDAADKMRRLLDELLELSRIGHTGDSPQEVAVDALVHEALELVAGRIAQCDIEVHVAPNLPVLYGQHSRLREVLQNLIDNAAKYMGNQPNPRIEIGSRHEEGEPVIYVRDNGIGIDPHHSDKVFGLFTKLDRESEGAGVGLALVKRIIETHEGRVWVESDGVDRGASFCFTVGLQGPTTKHHVNGMSTQQSNSTVVVRSAN